MLFCFLGRPEEEFFRQPISSNDHPMLRQFANGSDDLRKPGESELDFYERRYQERQKAERTSKPKPIQSNPYSSNAKLETGARHPPSNRR